MTSILWVSVETPDQGGQGGQRRQYHQIRALLERGHSVRVLTLASEQSATSISRLAPVERLRSSIKGRGAQLFANRIRRKIAADTSDVLIVSHLESCAMLPPQSSLGKPSLLDIHNVMSDWLLRQGLDDEARETIERERAATGRFSAISTCSDVETARLGEVHPSLSGRIFTAPLGVDPTEWPNPVYSRSRPLVAMFGSWDWRPNARGLEWFSSKVWPRVRERFPTAEGEVAGSGVSGQLAWPEGLRHVGRVPDLATFTAQATVVAVPVQVGVGASVKFAEALASGASVVATTDGANAFTNPPAFVSDDAEAWAGWIADRLSKRSDEVAPAFSRTYALKQLTWTNAIRPIESWFDTVAAATGAGG